MAPRANWKGYLRLSLVSCPIALYPASSLSEKVSFNRINRKTGNPLSHRALKLCPVCQQRPHSFADFAYPLPDVSRVAK